MQSWERLPPRLVQKRLRRVVRIGLVVRDRTRAVGVAVRKGIPVAVGTGDLHQGIRISKEVAHMVPTRANLDALEIGVAPAAMPEKHIPPGLRSGLARPVGPMRDIETLKAGAVVERAREGDTGFGAPARYAGNFGQSPHTVEAGIHALHIARIPFSQATQVCRCDRTARREKSFK